MKYHCKKMEKEYVLFYDCERVGTIGRDSKNRVVINPDDFTLLPVVGLGELESLLHFAIKR